MRKLRNGLSLGNIATSVMMPKRVGHCTLMTLYSFKTIYIDIYISRSFISMTYIYL